MKYSLTLRYKGVVNSDCYRLDNGYRRRGAESQLLPLLLTDKGTQLKSASSKFLLSPVVKGLIGAFVNE